MTAMVLPPACIAAVRASVSTPLASPDTTTIPAWESSRASRRARAAHSRETLLAPTTATHGILIRDRSPASQSSAPLPLRPETPNRSCWFSGIRRTSFSSSPKVVVTIELGGKGDKLSFAVFDFARHLPVSRVACDFSVYSAFHFHVQCKTGFSISTKKACQRSVHYLRDSRRR